MNGFNVNNKLIQLFTTCSTSILYEEKLFSCFIPCCRSSECGLEPAVLAVRAGVLAVGYPPPGYTAKEARLPIKLKFYVVKLGNEQFTNIEGL